MIVSDLMEIQANDDPGVYDATEVMRLQANDAVGFMELVYEGTSQLCYRSNEASSQ
jgi:hypothetical protein